MKLNSLLSAGVTATLTMFALFLASQFGCDNGRNGRPKNSSDGYSATDGLPGANGLQNDQVGQDTKQLGTNFSNLKGNEILQQSVARYSAAHSYQDQAVLYLNYILEGRQIQEPHPFSTAWDRQNHLASKIFNSQIQCDGRLLSCYVFDIETANLDNQQLFLPATTQIPISQLYSDSIVRHFVGGYSDLPLDETETDLPPKLIPPPISLLTGQIPFGWMAQPEQVERLPDETINEQTCYVVRSLYLGSTADIWIDQRTQLAVQISLPLRLMAREVLTSGEIQDVELMIRFHGASIDQPIAADAFQVQLRPDATSVRKLVSIPEPFPSELIGKTAPDFNLFQADRKPVNRNFFQKKATALLWLGGQSSFESIPKFTALSQEFPQTNFHFGAVYSDMELENPESGSLQLVPKLHSLSQANNIPFYYDQQLETSSRLEIKAIPTVIVLDGMSKVQFARALSDNDWITDLQAALQRINRGEDVAAEMQLEYQRFLDQYHQQLVAASASDLIGDPGSVAALPNSANSGSTGRVIADGFQTGNLKPKLEWTNSDFKRAGNILVDGEGDTTSIYVFDGWRTVVELDAHGTQLARHELELAELEAVSCIRVAQSNSTDPAGCKWAIFSVQGKQIYLFDRQWKSVATIPATDFTHDGIRDTQFADVNDDGTDDLVVAFSGTQGAHVFDLANRTTKPLAKLAAESLATIENSVVYCNQSQLGLLSDEATPVEAPAGLSLHSLKAHQSKAQGAICVLVSDANRNWFAAGLDSQWKLAWQQPIGSQLFEREIESVAFGISRGEIVFVVADVENRVNFFSQKGTYLGQFASPEPINGLALVSSNEGLRLLVSSKGVQSFRLESSSGSILPVSSQR